MLERAEWTINARPVKSAKMNSPRRWIGVFAFIPLLFSTHAADTNFFETKIRPVLVEHCYKCHSAESEKLKHGLHVDTPEGLLKGRETGPALLAGELRTRPMNKPIYQPPREEE